MTANIGSIDRIVRALLGIAIIVLGVVLKSWWGVIGVLPLATAVVGYCGAYTLLGINTCNLKAKTR